MPITVSELQNRITGDDADFQLAAKRTQATLTALEAQAKQAMTALSAAFGGLSPAINGITQSFETFGAAAQVSFNQVGAAAAAVTPAFDSIAAGAGAAGVAVSNAAANAGAGLGQISTGAAAAGQATALLGSELRDTAAGLAGISQSAIGAGSSVSDLALRKAELMSQLAGVSRELRSETSVMLGAQEAARALGGNSAQLNQVYAESQSKVADLAIKQQLLRNELGSVAAAMKVATVEQQATNVAQGAAGAATESLGQKTGILSALMSTHTSQISSQGTAWKGYDNVVQAAIRSMGGIPVVWALAITVGGVLLEKVISLGGAKKKTAEITDELIKNDLLLANAFASLAGSANEASGSIAKQADAYKNLLSVDLSSLLITFNDQYKTLSDQITEATRIQQSYNQMLAASKQVASEVVETDGMVINITAIAADATEKLSAAVAKETGERSKQEAVINKTADTLRFYRDATGQTTDAMLEQVRAVGASEDAIDRLRVAMDTGAVAARNLAEAISAAAKPPTFSVDATTTGLQKLFETAAIGASRSNAEFKNLAESTSANEKNLKALVDASQVYAKHQAAVLGITRDKNAVDTIARQKLQELAGAAGEAGSRVLSQARVMADATETTKKYGEGHRAAAGHVKALSTSVDELSTALRRAMADIVQAIDNGLSGVGARTNALGRQLHEMLVPIIAEAETRAKAFREQSLLLASALEQTLGPAIVKIHDVNIAGNASFDALIQKMAELRAASNQAAHEIQMQWATSIDQFNDLSRSLPQAWNTVIDGILSGSGRVGQGLIDLGIKVKGFANDLLNVFDNMPGKWGSAFQKAVGEVNKWINFLDSTIKLIQRILGETQTGLGGILQSVIGIFQGAAHKSAEAGVTIGGVFSGVASKAKTSAGQVVDSWSKGSDALKVGLGAAAGAFASLTTAMAVTAATGSKTAGVVSSLFTSTLAGIQAGMMFGPVGGAVVGGISLIGGLLGSLFGGKSALQKAQEAAALQKAKDDITISQQAALKAVEDTKQSMLATAGKIRDLLESITFYTSVPKEAFKAFFHDLDKLMSAFADRAKEWLGDASGKIKVFAEDMKVITEGIGGAVSALTALGPYPGVAEKAIMQFGNDLALVIGEMEAVAETFTRKALRNARKFAEQIGEVVQVIAGAVLAFSGTNDTPGLSAYQRVPAEVFDLFGADLELAVEKMGEIAAQIDKGMLKTAEFFASKTRAVVDVIAGAMLAFIGGPDGPGLSQYSKIPVEVFDQFFADLLVATNKMAEITKQIETSILASAENFAAKSLAVFKAIGEGVKAFNALRDYKSIASDAFEAFKNDFIAAIDLMSSLVDQSDRFIMLAKDFETNIQEGAAHLADAMLIFTTAIKNLGFGLAAFGVQVTFPGAAAAAAGSVVGAAASTVGIASLPAVPGSTLTTSSVASPAVLSGSVSSSRVDRSINFNAPIYLNGEAAPETFAQRFKNEMERLLDSQRASVRAEGLAS